LSPSGYLFSLFFTIAPTPAQHWCGTVLRSAQFLLTQFLEQIGFEFLVEHSQLTIDAGPLLGWAIVGELYPIAIRVMDVHHLAYAVVAHALDGPVVVEQSLERTGKFTPVWIEQGEVEEPPVALWRRYFAPMLDEADVVVVASGCRKKDQRAGRGLISHILGDLQAKDIPVKAAGLIEIAGPKGDVPDTAGRTFESVVRE
jgi:hypothetical protein